MSMPQQQLEHLHVDLANPKETLQFPGGVKPGITVVPATPALATLPGAGCADRDLVLQGYLAAQAFVGLDPLRLHLGAGTVRLDGWVDIDIEGEPDLRLDLRFGLPFPDGSVDRIHSEHVFEHFPLAIGRLLMAEAHRVLKPGGVIRTAMPDLEAVTALYRTGAWKDEAWLQDPAYDHIDTPAAYLNVCFREWGHEHLYDEVELTYRLIQAGFAEAAIARVPWGESAYDDLRGLETRPETRLVVEAVR